MIKKALVTLMVCASAVAFAQEGSDKAKSLDELLRMVEQGRASNAREQRERVKSARPSRRRARKPPGQP